MRGGPGFWPVPLDELVGLEMAMKLDDWLESQRINGGPHGFECIGLERMKHVWDAARAHEQSQCAKWLAATAPYLRDAFVVEFMAPNGEVKAAPRSGVEP